MFDENTGVLDRELCVPIAGGTRANPKKDIYKNNRKILLRAVDRVWKKIQDGGW